VRNHVLPDPRLFLILLSACLAGMAFSVGLLVGPPQDVWVWALAGNGAALAGAKGIPCVLRRLYRGDPRY
jgi:hypothetical protein